MTLHQINRLAYPLSTETTWQDCLQIGDQILLIEEGILRTQQNKVELEALLASKQVTLYYLQADADAYGIIPSIGEALSEEQWVDTTLSAEKNISW
ncbi:hypothetical protein OFY17_00250 [Marinomonas sp. C2222]|uniref:Protein TusB n=1 Tax=Marinomonas sargassi TaxID=2984494 RepID=A0ABT2YN33_9GAMM|nr:DsrH/TusB family sulfur metabolism protein [Marinomonas sargassi]MCV2401298.1 hypothetical protein [Marinomonas sargassi]